MKEYLNPAGSARALHIYPQCPGVNRALDFRTIYFLLGRNYIVAALLRIESGVQACRYCETVRRMVEENGKSNRYQTPDRGGGPTQSSFKGGGVLGVRRNEPCNKRVAVAAAGGVARPATRTFIGPAVDAEIRIFAPRISASVVGSAFRFVLKCRANVSRSVFFFFPSPRMLPGSALQATPPPPPSP